MRYAIGMAVVHFGRISMKQILAGREPLGLALALSFWTAESPDDHSRGRPCCLRWRSLSSRVKEEFNHLRSGFGQISIPSLPVNHCGSRYNHMGDHYKIDQRQFIGSMKVLVLSYLGEGQQRFLQPSDFEEHWFAVDDSSKTFGFGGRRWSFAV